MKKLCGLIIITMAIVVLIIVVSVIIVLARGDVGRPPESYMALKKRALGAIEAAGGASAVEASARDILRDDRMVLSGSVMAAEKSSSIIRLSDLLSPTVGGDVWLKEGQERLPAHIIIRFGSHKRYCYLWVFDPQHLPLGVRGGVEKLSDAIYLAEQNM